MITLATKHINILETVHPKCSNNCFIIKYKDQNGKQEFTILPYYFYASKEAPEILLFAQLEKGAMVSLRLICIEEVKETPIKLPFDSSKINSSDNIIYEDTLKIMLSNARVRC